MSVPLFKMPLSGPLDQVLPQWFEQTPDFVCLAAPDGFFRFVNRTVIQTLGYSREELFSRPIFEFIHPDDRERTGRRRDELLKGEALTDLHNRYVKKNGELVWLHWTSIYLPEQKLVFAIAKNITERKLREEEIERRYQTVRGLVTHFKHRFEHDRKELAHELHEDLAQLGAVVRMELDMLLQEPGLPNDLRQRVERAENLQGMLVQSIQNLSYTLRPAVLDNLGLSEALHSLCTELSDSRHHPFFFEAGMDAEALTPELRLDLFLIARESLHLLPSEGIDAVTVRLYELDGKICLSLEVAAEGQLPDPGLVTSEGLCQRIASIHGQVHLHTSGEGWELLLVVPPEPAGH